MAAKTLCPQAKTKILEIKSRLLRPMGLTVVPLLLLLVGCEKQDRLVTVSCGPPPGRTVMVDVRGTGENGPSIGVLDVNQFEPGAIIQLSSSPVGLSFDGARNIYQLKTSNQDFLQPRPEPLFGNVIATRFDIALDDDVRHSLRASYAQLEARIMANTSLVMNAQRKELRDPLMLINTDADASKILRNADKAARFLLIYAVSYGQFAQLMSLNYTSTPDVAINTLTSDDFYLHISFRCASTETIASQSQSTGSPVPILFYYLTIKYDPARNAVIGAKASNDPRAVSLLH